MRLRLGHGRPGVFRVATICCTLAALAGPASALAADGTTTPTTTTTTTATTAAPAPCVAAGVAALVEPGAASLVPVGPSVMTATKAGTSAPSFQDADLDVSVTDARVGAAGCVNGSAPGGTSTRTGAFSLFGGAIAGDALRADLVPAPGDGSGWRLRTRVDGLTAGGAPLRPVAGASVAVSDWGVLDVQGTLDGHTLQPLRYWRAALELRLTRAHAGLPAGTLVLIGYAGATRVPAPPKPPAQPAPPTTTTTATTTTTPTTTATTTTATTTSAKPKAAPHRSSRPARSTPTHAKKRAHRVRKRQQPAAGDRPLAATPPLGVSGQLFPVDGATSWGDTYGADRSDVSGGWHHGDDLFAPLGTPVVAVADGTVFAVGWNEVGGWRLWLTDADGNEYYYAHLSGYTALAQNNGRVRRGEVLGFVGNTGDAVTTAPHLHFEIHPNPLLYLGYDGAVDPTSYLEHWPRAANVVVPPPVRLPGAAPAGRGAVRDFRRLLAVHPMYTSSHAKRPPAARAARAKPRRHVLTEITPASARTAAAPVTGTHRRSDGPAAAIAGLLLLLGGVAVLLHTARAGRSS